MTGLRWLLPTALFPATYFRTRYLLPVWDGAPCVLGAAAPFRAGPGLAVLLFGMNSRSVLFSAPFLRRGFLLRGVSGWHGAKGKFPSIHRCRQATLGIVRAWCGQPFSVLLPAGRRWRA